MSEHQDAPAEPGKSAVFVLESHGDKVACKVAYQEGFDNDCIAHRTAALLVKLMDEHCDKLNPTPDAPKVKASAPKLLMVDGGRVRQAQGA